MQVPSICVYLLWRKTVLIRLDNFLLHGKFRLLSLEKPSSHNMPLPSFLFSFSWMQCFHTTGCEAYSFTIDKYGTFNMCTNVGACRTHKGGVKHKQVCVIPYFMDYKALRIIFIRRTPDIKKKSEKNHTKGAANHKAHLKMMDKSEKD